MKDETIIILLIAIILLLIYRRQSTYTPAQVTAFNNVLPNSIRGNSAFNQSLYDIVINQIKGLPVLTAVNNIITIMNSGGLTPPLTLYTSDDQIKTMFQNAYENGESGLTRTDKAILRVFSLVGIALSTTIPWGTKGLPALQYTSEGKPVWADEILAQTGLSINEAILKVFEAAKISTGTIPDVNVINSLLPENLSRYTSSEDFTTRLRASTYDATTLWFTKFIAIGPLYTLWIAENKWRLDLSWSFTSS